MCFKMDDIEVVARRVYPYILKWLGKAEVVGYYRKAEPEEIEKIMILPDAEFNGKMSGLVLSKALFKLMEGDGDVLSFDEQSIYDKYGFEVDMLMEKAKEVEEK